MDDMQHRTCHGRAPASHLSEYNRVAYDAKVQNRVDGSDVNVPEGAVNTLALGRSGSSSEERTNTYQIGSVKIMVTG